MSFRVRFLQRRLQCTILVLEMMKDIKLLHWHHAPIVANHCTQSKQAVRRICNVLYLVSVLGIISCTVIFEDKQRRKLLP